MLAAGLHEPLQKKIRVPLMEKNGWVRYSNSFGGSRVALACI